MPPRLNHLILILTVYILTLFTLLHAFRLALDLSPGRAPHTSNVNADPLSSSNRGVNLALFKPKTLFRTLFEPKPQNGQNVNWLARLGWGLGEATVEILESSSSRTFEARMAFFGRSIPEDGLVGWLVPLDSLFKPCHTVESETHKEEKITASPSSHTPIPAPFLPLDGAYVPTPETHSDGDTESLDAINASSLEDPENTGCPPQCPITQFTLSPDTLSTPFHPFPNTTWLALVRRGTCSFAAKARFAETLGASGLLVGGLDETLISMSAGSEDGDLEIRSIFVTNGTYSVLMDRVQQSGVRLDVDAGRRPKTQDEQPAGTAVDGEASSAVGRSVKTILIKLEGEPPWAWYTPILSVLLVLSLPSVLTLCTLFFHRIRAERREREMRAPEDIVAGLPIRVWNGVRWEKDLERGEQAASEEAQPTERSPILPVRSASKENDRTRPNYGAINDSEPSTSAPRAGIGALSFLRRSSIDATDTRTQEVPIMSPPESPRRGRHHQEDSDETIPRPPWFGSQTECAICLCDFEIGDRVRVLPCGHVFHLDEVDPWLIKQRKVVSKPKSLLKPNDTHLCNLSAPSANTTLRTLPPL
ncbi:hypothetical protein M408DRAFT_169230 [Serendipita vermifera MAFF 305830]|uniref:Uncharacterized protein n=1 Tax=Serendipita vermifera MAFF 305830 TaxID=933852 RepID=A0A0C2XE10_SERVB|nr:hypothetical protein M408DRAFT_169230 [Serendipita vermifera MAFF 305830]